MARGENLIVAILPDNILIQARGASERVIGWGAIGRLSEQGSLAGVSRLYDADNMTLGWRCFGEN